MPIETILQLLENGKWHHVKEMEETTHLTNYKVKHITDILAKYNFIKLDKMRQKVKLDPPTRKSYKSKKPHKRKMLFLLILNFGLAFET